jgi:hypothetical protein
MKTQLSMYALMLMPLYSNGMQQSQTSINSRILYQDCIAHLKNQFELESREAVRNQIKKNMEETTTAYLNEYDPAIMRHEDEAETKTSSQVEHTTPQQLRGFVLEASELVGKKQYLAAIEQLNTCLSKKKAAQNRDGELTDIINQLTALATQKHAEQIRATSAESK